MLTVTPEALVLWLHIAAGLVALLAGLGALGTEKGSDRHRHAGRFYVRSMAVVVGTVPVLLAFEPTAFVRQFLLLVAVFSGYLVFSGYRVLSRKRPADDSAAVDRLAAALTVLASLGLGAWGLVLAVGGTVIGVVMAVFGGIGLGFAVSDLREFRTPGRHGPWIADHLSRMIGGYVATVTAVSVVNFVEVLPGIVPGVVAWLWPTVAGVPLILYWQGKYASIGPLASVSR